MEPELPERELWSKIRQNYRSIVRDQDALQVLDFLYEKFIFNDEECSQVRAKDTPQERNRKLLDILSKKSESNHQSYMESLDASSHTDLADSIRKTKSCSEAGGLLTSNIRQFS